MKFYGPLQQSDTHKVNLYLFVSLVKPNSSDFSDVIDVFYEITFAHRFTGRVVGGRGAKNGGNQFRSVTLFRFAGTNRLEIRLFVCACALGSEKRIPAANWTNVRRLR